VEYEQRTNVKKSSFKKILWLFHIINVSLGNICNAGSDDTFIQGHDLVPEESFQQVLDLRVVNPYNNPMHGAKS